MADAQPNGIYIGMGEEAQFLELKYGNRHGLIAGATGTGKTVTLQTLAEGFSSWGVPVFAVDIKGDLSGMAQAGVANEFLLKRCEHVGTLIRLLPHQWCFGTCSVSVATQCAPPFQKWGHYYCRVFWG